MEEKKKNLEAISYELGEKIADRCSNFSLEFENGEWASLMNYQYWS